MKKTITLKISLSVLFLLCLLDWNYSYYQFVRFVGMVGFSILSYQQYKKNDVWFGVWLASAILINPIFKIALGRTLWNIIDVLWSILLIYSIFFEKGIQRHQNKKIIEKIAIGVYDIA